MTPNLIVRSYEEGDLGRFTPKAGFFSDPREIAKKVEVIRHSPKAHFATLCIEYAPIGVVGLIEEWPGVGHVWAVLSDRVREQPVRFHKTIVALIDSYTKALNLHRVHMTVRSDLKSAQKWSESLGFEFEGVLRKYGPDQVDHEMYSRVANG